MRNGVDELRVIPSQLRLAREAVALSVEEACQQLRVEAEELQQWERGTTEPPVEQLWELSELYGRATDFFLKRTPPPPTEISFRLRGKRGLRDLSIEARRAMARFEELCRAADELERITNTPRSVKLIRASGEEDSGRLAESERRRLGADGNPIENLRDLLERQGVRTFELPVSHSEFSGFSWWHEQYGPCIMVNGRDDPGRRTFSFAHEYAHLLKTRVAYVCDPLAETNGADERFADGFAAVFLMPAADLVSTFNSRGLSASTLNVKQLASLAGRYSASLQATAIRLEELGLVPRERAQSLVPQWQGHPRRPKTPAWERRLGRTYVSLASAAYEEGHISVGKLADYLGLSLRKAIAFAEEADKKRQKET